MVTYYSTEAIEKTLDTMSEYPNFIQVEVIEGCLGYGTTIAHADGCKWLIIQEHYLNEWSSGNSMRLYKKLPKKYEKLYNDKINEVLEELIK